MFPRVVDAAYNLTALNCSLARLPRVPRRSLKAPSHRWLPRGARSEVATTTGTPGRPKHSPRGAQGTRVVIRLVVDESHLATTVTARSVTRPPLKSGRQSDPPEQRPDETRDHMTRITVTNEVWREFREAARVRGISVTTYLVSGHRLWQRVPPELGRGLAYLH
jgi:hypothetical protein